MPVNKKIGKPKLTGIARTAAVTVGLSNWHAERDPLCASPTKAIV